MKEALKLALVALDIVKIHYTQNRHVNEAITAIKEALAQPEQRSDSEHLEPVAITITGKLGNIYSFTGDYSLKKGDKVYTTPPQRKPLTDDRVWLEYMQLWPFRPNDEPTLAKDILRFARAIESAHGIKEKNT